MCCLKLAIGGFLCEKSLLLSSDIQLIITQPIGDLKAVKVVSVFTFFLSPDQTSLLSPSLAPLSSHSTSLLYTAQSIKKEAGVGPAAAAGTSSQFGGHPPTEDCAGRTSVHAQPTHRVVFHRAVDTLCLLTSMLSC